MNEQSKKIWTSMKENPERTAVITGIFVATLTFGICTVMMSRKYMQHLDKVYTAFSENVANFNIKLVPQELQ